MTDMWTHRGWKISYDGEARFSDWEATHPDLPPLCAGTYEDLLVEIDCEQDAFEEANGQFGVGA